MMELLDKLSLLEGLHKQISALPSVNGLVMRDYVLEIVREHIRCVEEEIDQHAQRQAHH